MVKQTSAPQFEGFAPGKHQQISIPAQFFRDVLPHITDAAELQVLLFCFRALHQQASRVRYLVLRDFEQDEGLQHALKQIASADGNTPPDPDAVMECLQEALAQIVARGVLLAVHASIEGDAPVDAPPNLPAPSTLPASPLYFVNTARGRQAVDQIRAGNWQDVDGHIEILPERPNIYMLYEENIGILTPHIAEALRTAEAEVAYSWIEDAIKLAIENNARNWRYISAILKRWQDEGRATDAPTQRHRQRDAEWGQQDDREYGSGKYSDFIEK